MRSGSGEVAAFEGPRQEIFVGRTAQLRQIGDIVARVADGEPWLVVIEGESGIGKSALAWRGAGLASPHALLTGRADRSEADLDYGLVEQLLQRVDPELLEGRRLLASGVPSGASPFAVGAELLAVVGKVLAEGPVVLVVDDLQWADRPSVLALTFLLRRLSVDPLLALVMVRGDRESLDEATRRLLSSVERRLDLRLSGLGIDDVAMLAQAMGIGALTPGTVKRLHEQTGGHTLYLRTLLSEPSSINRNRSGRLPVTPSLAGAVGDQLVQLSAETRSVLEMLAVVDHPLPLARLGEVAGVVSPARAIEGALAAGLVDWSPEQPSCPVTLRHALQRDVIYSQLTPTKRRALHAQAISMVDASTAWAHRVAALDGPDDDLADQLAATAASEAAAGRLPLAASHLLWAGDISSTREKYEERLLTAATYLMLADEARGLSFARRSGSVPSISAAQLCAGVDGTRHGATRRGRGSSAGRVGKGRYRRRQHALGRGDRQPPGWRLLPAGAGCRRHGGGAPCPPNRGHGPVRSQPDPDPHCDRSLPGLRRPGCPGRTGSPRFGTRSDPGGRS